MLRPEIHVGYSTFYLGARRPVEEWEAAIRDLLDQSQWFLAYDLARQAVQLFPDNIAMRQFLARALTRAGALDEARELLEPLCAEFRLGDQELRELYQSLRTVLAEPPGEAPSRATLEALGDLLAQVGRAAQPVVGGGDDPESWGLLGRVYKDLWRRSGQRSDAERSRDTYRRGFERTGAYYPGANAASMSWILGDKPGARRLALEVLKVCKRTQACAPPNEAYWIQASIGEARLLLAALKPAGSRARDRHRRAAGPSPFVCEFVGTLALAKDFGSQAVYHLRRS